MKNLLLIFSFLAFFTISFAAAPKPALYGVSQNINFSKISKNTFIKVPLTSRILQANNLDFGQLQIIDDKSEPVSFFIQETPAKKIDYIESLEVSSSKNEKLKPENLLDNNRFTEFEFNKIKDKKNPATLLINFGKAIKINRIKLWSSDQSDIRGIEIKGGFQKNNLKTLKRKTKFKNTFDSDFPTVQFLKISFWGKKIRLDDILFYTPYTASVYFQAQSNTKYKILFGGDEKLDSKRFTHRTPETPEKFITASLNPEKFQNEDIDQDSIKNSEDNCPFTLNKTQKDSDGDLVGDKCDNAPQIKNKSQIDSDRDLIGDILDNCNFTPNPNQKDNDKDLMGNLCDPSPDAGNGKSFFSNLTNINTSTPNSGGFWGYIIGVLIAFFGGAMFLGRNMKRKK